MSTTSESTTLLPAGVWQVDSASSELGFGARGMFGFVPVHGHFGDFEGTLTVDAAGARGELRIKAATLDTHNAKRDTHLRSADFFDVENHPIVTFELTGVTPAAGGAATVAGVLRIRDSALKITAPLAIDTPSPDQLALSTALEVDRAAAGVGWSKLGMIKGKASLRAKLTLTRQS
jgi:polyisoprenoid-binding protein YceI